MGTAELMGYSSPNVASTYSSTFQSTYDQTSMLPAVLPNDGFSYSSDYPHCGSSTVAQNASTYGNGQYTPLTSPWTNEMDQYNYGNYGYQYSACQPAVQSQYTSTAPPPQPTMVLYPQLYSTVNQNQIHLHLHGSEKLVEQYLGGASGGQSDNSFTLSTVIGNNSSQNQRPNAGLDMPLNNMIQQSDENIKNHQDQVVDQEVGDPSVWRPY
jgi:RUNX transcription factor Lozenge